MNKAIQQYKESHGFGQFSPKAVLFDMDGVYLLERNLTLGIDIVRYVSPSYFPHILRIFSHDYTN